MDKTIHLQITSQDIRCSTPRNPSNCPIALAVKRATGASQSSVAGWIQWTMPSGQRYLAFMPPVAAQFIMAYDDDHLVQPFNCEIEPLGSQF